MNRQSAFAVALAASATAVLGFAAAPAPASAISLKQLIDTNGFIVNGDKKFSEFRFASTCDNVIPLECTPFSADQIAVTAVTDPDKNFGIRFNGFFSAPGGHVGDVDLDYTVEVLDPDFWISDVHLDADFNERDGLVNITERFKDMNGNPISLLDMNGNPITALEVDNDPTNDVPFPPAWADLVTPVKKLKVTKDIGFAGFDPVTLEPKSVAFSIVDQTFSQTKDVPEPAAVGGLLAIGSIGIGAILKRNRQEKNKLDS